MICCQVISEVLAREFRVLMRSWRSLFSVGLLVVSTTVTSAAQSNPIQGPVLGFTPNSAGSILWPMLGIPGASMLGYRIEMGVDIDGAVVSPRQNYALAIRREDGRVVLIRLTSNPPDVTPITGQRSGRTVLAISPTGSAAALYDEGSRRMQTFRSFPGTPELAFEFDTSLIPGRAIALAVSDDATTAVIGFEESGNATVWVVNAAGARFISQNRASSVSFIVNQHDAVVTDGLSDDAYLLQQLDQNPARTPLFSSSDGIEGLSGAAVSDDGRFVLVAGARSGTVGVLDLQQGIRTILTCNCQPTGVHRLTGTAVFRLNEPGNALVTVIDLESPQPRILVVPATPGSMDITGVEVSH